MKITVLGAVAVLAGLVLALAVLRRCSQSSNSGDGAWSPPFEPPSPEPEGAA